MEKDKDSVSRKELQRVKNRMLDFNPKKQTTVPTATDGVRGVDNAHVLLSASTNYHLVFRIDGVPFRVALTSAF